MERRARRAGSLESPLILDTLEAPPEGERAGLLRACRRACRRKAQLLIADRAFAAAPNARFAERLGKRHALRLVPSGTWRASTPTCGPDFGGASSDPGQQRSRPPRAHGLVTWPGSS